MKGEAQITTHYKVNIYATIPKKSFNPMLVLKASIVDKTDWFGSLTSFKKSVQSCFVYVEQTVTMHTVLFSVLAQMLLLVSCHMHINTFCVLCRVKANNNRKGEQKHTTKKLVRFITSLFYEASEEFSILHIYTQTQINLVKLQDQCFDIICGRLCFRVLEKFL